ncbi:MAG: precorrin-8X methylmutase [Desulfobacteraceae bacterium]|nr:precorrin-8X methylmutase [Desulfobacteraceae bacterium]
MNPYEIEKQSFRIIEQEAGPHGFTPDQWSIVSRMIHTSADFDYLKSVLIHPDAVSAGISAIQDGRAIITDTNMVRAGIRTKDAAEFGSRVECLMEDPAVKKRAEKEDTTRAAAAVDAAVSNMEGGICAVGNAPTALLRLIELIRWGSARPALIVGFPVGFVNASESKEILAELDLPYITNKGRKGGSAVAAAAINALLILAGEKGV